MLLEPAFRRLVIGKHSEQFDDRQSIAFIAFGILHSRFHEVWSLRMGTWLGKGNDPRYTPTITFETFPFPERFSPDVHANDYLADPRAQAIASASRRLVEFRDRWLNPHDLVEWVDELVEGYPKRPKPAY